MSQVKDFLNSNQGKEAMLMAFDMALIMIPKMAAKIEQIMQEKDLEKRNAMFKEARARMADLDPFDLPEAKG